MNKEKKERLLQDSIIKTRAESVGNLINTIFGEKIGREGLQDTPLRVAAMYNELFSGYEQDGKQILNDAMFTADSHDLVIVKDIQFYSTCEHHMMPFFGTATVAYIPQDGRIVGLSKIARLVEVYARRLQVQERMGKQILNDIIEVMNPLGVAVILKAEHTCMTARGIQKPGTQTITSAMEGIFKLDDKARNELLVLLGQK